MSLWNWLHILAAYLIYILIAVITSVVVSKTSGDLKDFSVRNSPRVLLLGGVANLIAMLAILALLVFWDKRSISDLGLDFSRIDMFAAAGGFIATFLLAILFLFLLKQTHRINSLDVVQPTQSSGQSLSMLIGLLVLVTIVLQEEVLNRGYVALNLRSLGTWGVVFVSTTIFVLIHVITNRTNVYQLISWIVSGLVLITSYLLSGSIWLPIVLHYATDATNTLIFNITGQYSFFKTSPFTTEGQRAAFRLVYGVVMMGLLFSIYGMQFKFFM
jgi:membrane protease YdiL (CAAX protease family)